MVMVARWSG